MVTHVFDNSNLSQEIFPIDTWGAVVGTLSILTLQPRGGDHIQISIKFRVIDVKG